MAIEVAEIGVQGMTLGVPIGLNVRPVLVLEFFPEDPYAAGGRLTVTHGGWEGEVTDFMTAAAVLRETAAALELAAHNQQSED